MFPTFDEFTHLFIEHNMPKLFKLNYKTITFRLSGIQVMFSDGYESDMLETENSIDDEYRSILFDPTQSIKSI